MPVMNAATFEKSGVRPTFVVKIHLEAYQRKAIYRVFMDTT